MIVRHCTCLYLQSYLSFAVVTRIFLEDLTITFSLYRKFSGLYQRLDHIRVLSASLLVIIRWTRTSSLKLLHRLISISMAKVSEVHQSRKEVNVLDACQRKILDFH